MFVACEATSPQRPEGNAGAETQAARTGVAGFASAPPDWPGLGTKWGEKRPSLVGMTFFDRAN
ncbi:MAG: hypothetical protein DMF04_12695 [Verrucomicrobia bacterium]|nr:MAG: hypothetical protein DMF04_12695 [Verrucomicrobiota bacterium]